MPTSGLWTFDICGGDGVKLTSLTRHQGTRLSFTRNGVPECEFSLSHDDDECAVILTADANGTGGGRPTLKGYRTNAAGTPVLRFNGYLAATSEESGVDASTATFTFRGVFGRVVGGGSNQGWFLSAAQDYLATDAGAIAVGLLSNPISLAPNLPSMAIGTVETSKVRDRSYLVGQPVGEGIVNLTNVLDGFDFEVAPRDEAFIIGTFNVYARQGMDRPSAKFEYGPSTLANCSAFHRQTVPPINDVWLYGANGLVSHKVDFTSQAKYGIWPFQQSITDVSEQATLDDKAWALIRPNPVKAVDFTPDPGLAPSPWDDYWIGDTVRFIANRGALVEGPLSVRVNQITVVIDPDTGLEAAEIPDPVSPDEERVIRAGLQTEVAEGAVL